MPLNNCFFYAVSAAFFMEQLKQFQRLCCVLKACYALVVWQHAFCTCVMRILRYVSCVFKLDFSAAVAGKSNKFYLQGSSMGLTATCFCGWPEQENTKTVASA